MDRQLVTAEELQQLLNAELQRREPDLAQSGEVSVRNAEAGQT